GPTTHQLWKRAAEAKGISREFGLCFSCGAEIDTQANLCPSCNRLQEPPANPDVLVDSRGGNGDSSGETSEAPPAPPKRRHFFERPLAPPSMPTPTPVSAPVPPMVSPEPPAPPPSMPPRSLESAARAAASYEEPAAIEMSPTTISMSED